VKGFQMSESFIRTSATDPLGYEINPIIIRRDSGFCVHLPKWNVSGEGRTVEEAYSQFEANRLAFEQRKEIFGLVPATAPSYALRHKSVLWQELALFFTKTAVASAAVLVVVILLLPNIGAAARHQITAMIPATMKDPLFWMVQFPAKVNGRLDRMAPSDAEQMNKQWTKLIERSTPTLRALKCPL
jgi:hypothetical protein